MVIIDVLYRMEGNFGSRKLWQIHCINTFGKKVSKFVKFSEWKNILEIYSVKHSECWCQGLQCQKSWRQQENVLYVMFLLNSMVWRYHEYKSLWTNMFDGEELIYKQEICISCDPQAEPWRKRHAMCYKLLAMFLDEYCQFAQYSLGEIIKCTVTGCRSYSYSYYALVVLHLVSQEHTWSTSKLTLSYSNTSAIKTFVTWDFLKLLKFGLGTFGEFIVVCQICQRLHPPNIPSIRYRCYHI